MRYSLLLLFLAALLSAAPASASSPAGCEWTVTGKVRVNHAMPELEEAIGEFSDLAGIKVKVSAQLRTILGWTGIYDKWAETTTNSQGEFTIRHTASCDGIRRFRVKVKFQSDDLELRHATATSSLTKVKWYTIVDQDENNAQTDHTVDVGTKTFDWQHAHDLNEMEARGHAEMWVVYSALLDKLDEYGSNYGFTEQLKVKYPHNSALANDDVEGSYANPITNVVYIHRGNDCPPDRLIPAAGACNNHLNVGTLLHEAMHVWAYQHSTGEDDLALNLITSGSTHCFEPSHIAFHEGFAEFASERLSRILFGMEAPLPITRDAMLNGLSCEGRIDELSSLTKVEEHDYGWITAFRTMIKNNLHNWTFAGEDPNTDFESSDNEITLSREGGLTPIGSCDSPDIVFKDVLTAFMAYPSKGHSYALAKSEMNLEDFVERLTDIHDLGDDTRDALLTLMDPTATEQPRDLFCEGGSGRPRLDPDLRLRPEARGTRRGGN